MSPRTMAVAVRGDVTKIRSSLESAQSGQLSISAASKSCPKLFTSQMKAVRKSFAGFYLPNTLPVMILHAKNTSEQLEPGLLVPKNSQVGRLGPASSFG